MSGFRYEEFAKPRLPHASGRPITAIRAAPLQSAATMPERVTILGDGAMATVCSILLTQGGHDVTMWGAFEESIERLIQDREQRRLLPGVKVPPQVHLTANDAQCFDGATMVLSAVPTQYMRGVWKRLAKYLPADVPIVSVAKGIENESLLRPTQVIADVLWGRGGESARREDRGLRIAQDAADPSSILHPLSSSSPRLAALSGPNIAAELAR